MNFNAVCRTCLTTQNLNPIFAGSVDDKRYSAAVFITTGIKVAIDDGLPQQMCATCISFSNAYLKFRKQCKDAETRLLHVKTECDGAAETLHSEGLSNKDMRLELKAEEDSETDNGNVTIKSEADSEVEDNTSGAQTTEEDLLQLKPAGGAGAAPECTHTCPEEGPPCKMHKCKTCLDCASWLSDHNCTNSVQGTNLNKVYKATAKTHFKCDLSGTQYVQKRYIIRHLAANNVQQGDEKLGPYSSEDDKFANTEEISYSGHVSETQFKDQSALTIHTGERPGTHICDMCSKEFSQKQHLIRHIRKLHRDDIDNKMDKYICNICKKQFRRLSNLNIHIRVHTGEKPFTCDVCKKQFTQRGALNRHRLIHTGKKPFTCDLCKQQFMRSSGLNLHRLIHTGEKPFSCNVCMKQFNQSSTLTRHRRIHTGEKPFTCNVCMKQFKQRSALTIHGRIHTGEKPYGCSICNKQFALKHDLTSHLRRHTGVKSYSCDVCKKKFAEKSNLNQHMRIHTGEKPFTCDICKKQFMNGINLTRHRRIHTGEKPYGCSVCNKQFVLKQSLTSHLRKHTGEKPYSCDVCKKKFAEKSYLNQHMRIHTGEKPFTCDILVDDII